MSENKFELRIDVSVRQTQPYNGGELRIAETIEIGSAGFMDMARLLSQFHDLAERMKVENSTKWGDNK